jgi:hypothetical protein
MTPCSVRTYGECSCSPSECRASKPATAAPLPRATTKDILYTAAFFGVVAFFMSIAIVGRAEQQQKLIDLKCQERCVTWKR